MRATEMTSRKQRPGYLSNGALVCLFTLLVAPAVHAQGTWGSGTYSPAYPQHPYNYDDGQLRAAPGQGAPMGGGYGYTYQDRQQPAYGYGSQFQDGFGQQPLPEGGGYGYQGQHPSPYGGEKRVHGGPSPAAPVSGFPGYQQSQQPVFGYGSDLPRTGHVPTPGFRFRDTNRPPEPEVDLPKFRPDSMLGNSPYSWGGGNTHWPQGGMGPAPVFRPLDESDRARAKRSAERGGSGYPEGYGQPGYAAPGYGYGYPAQ